MRSQSHFASGGDVRGFYDGKNVELSDFERRHPEVIDDTIGSRWMDVLGQHGQTDKDILGADVLGSIADRWRAMHARHMQNDEDLARGFKQTWEESTSPIGGPSVRTSMPESDYRTLEEKGAFGPKPPGMLDKIASYISTNIPKESANVSSPKVPEEVGGATERDLATLDRLTENYPRSGILAAAPSTKESKSAQTKTPVMPATWKPKPHDGMDVKPSARLPDEATKVDRPFNQAKTDVPSAAVTPDSEASAGLGALGGGGLEHMRDLLAELRGHKEMSPEISQKLADLEDKSRTSTILQSVLGGLAGGLSNPYGGRFALGSSAAGALAGYQKGVGSEEEMNRSAFNILKGYADAPAEEKAKAVDLLMDVSKEKMRAQSAADLAEARGAMGLEKAILQGGFAKERANIMSGGQEAKLAQFNMKQAETEYNDWLENEMKDRRTKVPAKPITDQEKAAARLKYYKKWGVEGIEGFGSPQNVQQSSGLGGGGAAPFPVFTRQR